MDGKKPDCPIPKEREDFHWAQAAEITGTSSSKTISILKVNLSAAKGKFHGLSPQNLEVFFAPAAATATISKATKKTRVAQSAKQIIKRADGQARNRAEHGL